MGFLDDMDPRQKKILMIGAPVVGIAAIYSISRGGPSDDEDEDVVTDEATGGSGVGQVGVIPGGQSTGAVGVGELSSFLGNVSDALRTYRDENAEAIAALRADNQSWQALLEEQLAARGGDQEQTSPTPTPNGAQPQAVPQSIFTVGNQYQQVIDLFARKGVALTDTHGPSTESPYDRVARISRELESGTRTYADVEKSLDLLAKAKR